MKRRLLPIALICVLVLASWPMAAGVADAPSPLSHYDPQPVLTPDGWGLSTIQAEAYVVAGTQLVTFDDDTPVALTVTLSHRDSRTLAWSELDKATYEGTGQTPLVAATAPCERGTYRMVIDGECGAHAFSVTNNISTGAGRADEVGTAGQLEAETQKVETLLVERLLCEENADTARLSAERLRDRLRVEARLLTLAAREGLDWNGLRDAWSDVWSGNTNPHELLEQQPLLPIYHALEWIRGREESFTGALSRPLHDMAETYQRKYLAEDAETLRTLERKLAVLEAAL